MQTISLFVLDARLGVCEREEGKEEKERMGEQLAHSPSFPLSLTPTQQIQNTNTCHVQWMWFDRVSPKIMVWIKIRTPLVLSK